MPVTVKEPEQPAPFAPPTVATEATDHGRRGAVLDFRQLTSGSEHLFDTLSRVSSSLAERFPVLTQVAASERTLPVHDSLVELLPALQRGSTIACSGRAAVSLALALAAGPSRDGAWVGIAGLPELGVRAAADMGLALERLVMVAGDPPWVDVLAAMIDGFDVILVGQRVGAPRQWCSAPVAGQGAVAWRGDADGWSPRPRRGPATDHRRRPMGGARQRPRGGDGPACAGGTGWQAHAPSSAGDDVVTRCRRLHRDDAFFVVTVTRRITRQRC